MSDEPFDDAHDRRRKPVHLPFNIGDIVYHRIRTSRVPGMVIGFIVIERGVKVLVKWGDDLSQCEHHLFELTEEYLPDFTTEG